MSTPRVHTYHCLCAELVLATFTPLQNLPKRKGDGAHICRVSQSEVPVPAGVVLSDSTLDVDAPVVLRLEDGFEKRYGLQCKRCALQIGYRLDKSQFGEKEDGVRGDVLYLLPGGLASTEDMKKGKVTDSARAVD